MRLTSSGDAISQAIEQAVADGGRVKGFKPHVTGFLGYMCAHDAHHRSQIIIALKQSGHPLDKKDTVWYLGMGLTMSSTRPIKNADKIPYKFILEHILRDDLVIKPMFGCYSLYAGGKLCLFLVDRKIPVMRPDGESMENGVHIATTTEHDTSLKPDFPDTDFDISKMERFGSSSPAIIRYSRIV